MLVPLGISATEIVPKSLLKSVRVLEHICGRDDLSLVASNTLVMNTFL